MRLPLHLAVIAVPLLAQLAALAGALWALRQATLSMLTVRHHLEANGRRIAARFMLARTITTTLLLLLLAALALLRIGTADLTREPSQVTWSLHLLLAACQLGVSHVVLGDVYERWRLRRHYQTTPAAERRRIEQEVEDDG